MLILGIDEARRGPVLGPMIIAGVLLDERNERKFIELKVKDSKLLTPKKRVALEKEIKRIAEEIHIVEISAQEIDEKRKRMSLNELEAMKMVECLELFEKKPDKIIIDLPDPNNHMFIRRMSKYADIKPPIVAEHKADVKYPVVSAASIIAKVFGDARLREFEKEHGPLGVGYPHDERTIKFLEKCMEKGEFPDIVRKSWITAKRIRERKYQKKLSEYEE